ncbi:MAG TPA: HYR domain-containing protein, partial [Ilumatobacteraceae bacterium]|nr:HYR domain-containing protein [Ilumatobacteraceae bacterium]
MTATVSFVGAARVRLGPAVPDLVRGLSGRVDTALDIDLGDTDLTWTSAWNVTSAGGMAAGSLLPGATLTGSAMLPFLEPATVVSVAGTYVADGWTIDGSITGAPTVAGLTVTGGDLHAELTSTSFTGTATLGIELPIGGAAPIDGNLVVDWSPAGVELAGSMRLDGVTAGSIARFDGITLTFTTTSDVTAIELTSDPDGAIVLFPGQDLFTLNQPFGSLTSDGVLTIGAASATGLIAGEVVVSAVNPSIVLDPAAAVPSTLLTLPSATGSVPSLGDVSVTFNGLQLMNDGTFRATSIVADPADITDTLGIAGILPFDVDRVAIVFPDESNLDRFDATVSGTFDFDALGALPFTPILTIGERSVDATTPEGDQQRFTFTVRAESLSAGDIRPLDLGPITIGFADLAAGPLTLGAAITLGEYDGGELLPPDGFSTGEISGWMSVVATGNGLSGSVEATLTGSLDVTESTGVLDLSASIVAGGEYDDVFTIEDLALGVSMRVRTDDGIVSLERFDVDDVTVGLLSVAFGDIVRLTVRDATLAAGTATFALAPEPGTDWITIGGTPQDPGAQIELIGSDFVGWGGSIGNVALRASEDGDGNLFIVPVLLSGFYADVTIGESPSLGFPDWLPLRVDHAGLSFPDVTPAELADGVELNPELLEGLRVRLSASLVASDTFPITGAVEGLEVDLGLLAAGDFPITNLDAAMFGVEPFTIGPMTVGGGLGLGIIEIDVDDDGIVDDRVFFARVFGEFAYSGFGAGIDMVLTQYGPVLAKISAPTPIPLGTSGLMLAGVRGGIQFGGEGFTPPADPIELLTSPQYDLDFPITFDTIRESVLSCAAENAGRSGTPDATWPCFTWNDGGTVTIGTTLTSYAAPGVVSADLNGAIDLRFAPDGSLPALRLAATGTVDVWGIEIADAGVLVAFDDPLAPTLDMAVQMPGVSGPVGFIIPATGRFTVHVGTDGIAAGAIEATRILLTTVAEAATTGSEELFGDALDALAASLEEARTFTDATGNPLDRAATERVAPYRPLVAALLDVNGDGIVSPAERQPIDRGFLLDRMLGSDDLPALLPTSFPTSPVEAAALGQRLVPVLRAFQAALIGEAERLATVPGASYDLDDFMADPDVDTYTTAGLAFVDLMRDAVLTGMQEGAAAWGEMFDPVLRFEGAIQPVIGGVPFGEPTDSGTFTIGRDQIGFGLSGSVESLYLSTFGTVGIVAAELNKVFGVNSIISAEGTLAVPDVFAAVAQGDLMVLDPFDADWNVQLAVTSKVLGFTFAESRGVLIPPDLDPAQLRMLVCRVDRPDLAPCGGDRIPVNGDEHWDAIEQLGGLILSHELLAPRFASDPAGVVDDLDLELPDEWLGWLKLIENNITAVSALDTVGSYQIFIPSLQTVIDPAYAVERTWPTASTDLERFGFDTVEATVEAGELLKEAFFAEGSWDVNLLGLPLTNGVISVDDDAYEVDAAFPLFGNVPVTVEFGGVSVTAGGDPIALPVPGFDVTVTGDDPAAALAGFGLPELITLDGTASVRLQGYGPGYDPDSPVAIRRHGGLQVDATLDLAGLVDGAEFTLTVVGTDPATADLHGSAHVDQLGPFAGVTITDATLTLQRVAGTWSLGVSGSATTTIGAGTVTGTLDGALEGSLTVHLGKPVDLGGFTIDLAITVAFGHSDRGGPTFAATLHGEMDYPALGMRDVTVDGAFGSNGIDHVTLDVTAAPLGPVQLTNASFELQQHPPGSGTWRMEIGGTATVPGVLDPVTVDGSLSPSGVGTLTIVGSGDLHLGGSATPWLVIASPTASIIKTSKAIMLDASGTTTILGASLAVTGSLSLGSTVTGSFTAATPADGTPFGAATLHGSFTIAHNGSTPSVSFAGTVNVPGISSSLGASGSISSSGAITLQLTASSLTIDGFTLTNGSFAVVRTPVSSSFLTTLTVDAELGVLGVTADVAGSVGISTTTMSGNLALSTAQPFALGGFQLTGGFTLQVGSFGARLGVNSKLTVPAIVAEATVNGQLDWSSGHLVGSLTVVVPTAMPLGGAGSALRLGGSMTLTRQVVLTSPPGPQLVTKLSLTGGSLNWSGVDTFDLPDFTIASDGSFDVEADDDTFSIGQFTLGLPNVDVHVGPAGAGTELRIGTATLSITGLGQVISIPAFDVATSGDFARDLPGLSSLGIGGYDVDVIASLFRFERVNGVFRLRLNGPANLDVPGLPATILLDTFQIASNGTVAAVITVSRIGPPALSIRGASMSFTRTATTGPNLAMVGGTLHLPIGQPISLPTLTFDSNGDLARNLTRALTLGPGFVASSVPLELVAEDGVIRLNQTANRSVTLIGSTVTLEDFTAGSDGSFSGSVTGTVKPLGFELASASFTISKTAGSVDATITLDDADDVDFGVAEASVSGWVRTNGRFQFTSTVTIEPSSWFNLLDPPRLVTLDGSVSVTLKNWGMSGTFSGELCLPFGACVSTSNGDISATGRLVGTFHFDPPGSNLDGSSNAFYQDIDIQLFNPVPPLPDSTSPSIAPIDDVAVNGFAPSPAFYSVNVSDDRDNDVAVSCTKASGATFPAGTTVVTCTATDDAGNTATRSFTVTVLPLIGYVIAIGGTTASPGSTPVTMPIGSAATVTVGGFAPNTPVKGIMHSTPTALGS